MLWFPVLRNLSWFCLMLLFELCFLRKCWDNGNAHRPSSSHGVLSFSCVRHSLNTPQTYKPLPWPRMPLSHLSSCCPGFGGWDTYQKSEPLNLPENLPASIHMLTPPPPQATFGVLLCTQPGILLASLIAVIIPIPPLPACTPTVCESRDQCLLWPPS